MAKIPIFYGSTTGNTEAAAQFMKEQFDEFQADLVELIDVAELDDLSQLGEHNKIIIGCPTWNVGELQSDWDMLFEKLDDVDLKGKQVAMFGTGDQMGYAFNFQDALGIIGEKVEEQGGQLVGFWPTDEYEFDESLAVRNGHFMGLALDDDNESDLTEERVQTWVKQLIKEFNLEAN